MNKEQIHRHDKNCFRIYYVIRIYTYIFYFQEVQTLCTVRPRGTRPRGTRTSLGHDFKKGSKILAGHDFGT